MYSLFGKVDGRLRIGIRQYDDSPCVVLDDWRRRVDPYPPRDDASGRWPGINGIGIELRTSRHSSIEKPPS